MRRRATRRYVARLAATGDTSQDGRWTREFGMPVVGVHAVLLPTGKVMLFSQKVNDYKGDEAAAYLWDPTKAPGAAGEFKAVPPTANIWCGAQSLMADGQLLVTGGNLDYPSATSGWKGMKTVFTFDPWTETWTRQPDMARGRWYPTQTLLPDGRTLITSGIDDVGGYAWNTDIDVFNPPSTRGGRGSISTIARYGDISGAPNVPHWYPHWFVMPGGGVLNAGFKLNESWLLDVTPGAVKGSDRPDWSMGRKYGSAVLLPGTATGSTRVMQLGGYSVHTGNASVASTEIYDEATPSVKPVPGPVMRVPRTHQNTVLLPDRSMVNIGGGYGEVEGTQSLDNVDTSLAAAGPEHRQVEILDPGSSTWRLGPAQIHKRAYHSTAVLLPDGRVLSAGDDRDPKRGSTYNARDRGEIYEPAYLHKPGARPAIVNAPDGVGFGQRFDIGTDTAISSAVLIAPGATTHANDMHQRLVPLSITPNSDGRGAAAVAPPSANVAPPGYYMLFALAPNGKPSVAKWVYVGQNRPASTPTETTPTETTPTETTPTETTPAQDTPSATPSAPTTGGQPSTGGQPPTDNSQAGDSAAPRARVRIASDLTDLRRRGRLVLRVTLNEAGTAQMSAVLRNGSATRVRAPRRGTRSLTFTRAQTKRLVLRLSRAERRRLGRRALKVAVTSQVRDVAGNRATRYATLSLRR